MLRDIGGFLLFNLTNNSVIDGFIDILN